MRDAAGALARRFREPDSPERTALILQILRSIRRQRRELRARHPKAFRRVDRILWELDPVGLRAAGCPRDEYNGEVVDILGALARSADTNSLRAFIEVELSAKFGIAIGPDVAHRVAARCVAEVAELRDCPRPML